MIIRPNTIPGGVKVNHVESPRPCFFPSAGHRRGIVAEHSLTPVITLGKSDTVTVSKIDCWQYFHVIQISKSVQIAEAI
jgi:hypothetical protein